MTRILGSENFKRNLQKSKKKVKKTEPFMAIFKSFQFQAYSGLHKSSKCKHQQRTN